MKYCSIAYSSQQYNKMGIQLSSGQKLENQNILRAQELPTFNQHEKNIKDKNYILKILAGSTLGKDKETLEQTFKVLGRSTANYMQHRYSLHSSEGQTVNYYRERLRESAKRIPAHIYRLSHNDE